MMSLILLNDGGRIYNIGAIEYIGFIEGGGIQWPV